MTASLDFYFDFSSPYGYLASEQIESLASRHGREVRWHPILLGVIFKETGGAPLTEIPLKGEYSKRDMARTARFLGVQAFRMPPRFPIPAQAPSRIVLWLRERDPVQGAAAIHALYRAYFADGLDISSPDTAADVVAKIGVQREAARAAIDDAAIKDALRNEVAEAIGKGVFGSPFVIVDGEPFWGVDRLPQIERWLTGGPF